MTDPMASAIANVKQTSSNLLPDHAATRYVAPGGTTTPEPPMTDYGSSPMLTTFNPDPLPPNLFSDHPKRKRRTPKRRAAPTAATVGNSPIDDAAPAEPIKPIETIYKGYRFRSRLEARWAVWFDHLGIEWLYEPEGYTVGPIGERRRYLPDFYLPEQRIWVEVKGSSAALDVDLLASAAHPITGLPLSIDGSLSKWALMKTRVLVLGPVPATEGMHTSFCVIAGELVAYQYVRPICHDVGAHLCHSLVGIGHPARLQDGMVKDGRGGIADPTEVVHDRIRSCDDISAAYRAARSARFEHGKSG